MRNLLAIAVLASAFVGLAGCKNPDSAVTGKWSMELKISDMGAAGSSPMGQQLMKTITDMFKNVSVDMKADHTFSISGMTNPLNNQKSPEETGTWSIKDKTVTMSGSTKGAGGSLGAMGGGAGANKDLTLTLSDDGSTMTANLPASQQGKGSILFHKKS